MKKKNTHRSGRSIKRIKCQRWNKKKSDWYFRNENSNSSYKLNMFSIAIECYSNGEPLLKHLNPNVKYRSESKQLEMGFHKFTKSEF